jgi:hypothetical protein
MAKDNDHHFLEAFLTNVEALADTAVDNELTRSIPIVGTAFKIAKGLDDLRSKALEKKLFDFLTAPELQTNYAKVKIAEKIRQSPDEAARVGETLFLVLDRIVDLQKPRLLSKLFLAYVDNRLTAGELRRLSEAVDMAFIDDIQELLSCSKPSDSTYQSLISSGLAEIDYNSVFGHMSSIDFRLSKHGKKLKEVLGEGVQYS